MLSINISNQPTHSRWQPPAARWTMLYYQMKLCTTRILQCIMPCILYNVLCHLLYHVFFSIFYSIFFLTREEEMSAQRAREAKELITDLGPAFVKIVQDDMTWPCGPKPWVIWVVRCGDPTCSHVEAWEFEGPTSAKVFASRPDALPEAYQKEGLRHFLLLKVSNCVDIQKHLPRFISLPFLPQKNASFFSRPQSPPWRVEQKRGFQTMKMATWTSIKELASYAMLGGVWGPAWESSSFSKRWRRFLRPSKTI